MKKLLLSYFMSGAALFASTAQTDLNGTWTLSSKISGRPSTATLHLKVDGQTVTGAFVPKGGKELPVSGNLKDDSIFWYYDMTWEKNTLTMAYTGKVAADGTIAGMVEVKPMGVQGSFVAIRASSSAVNLNQADEAVQPRSDSRAVEKPPIASAGTRGLALAANNNARPVFYVGTIGNPDNLDELRQLIPNEFNSLTPENALKWPSLLKEKRLGKSGAIPYDFSDADSLVDFAIQHGARVRGHNLIWGRFLPDEFLADLEVRLSAAPNRREAVRNIVRSHIATVMEHFKGRVREWDVLNEPLQIGAPELDETVWFKEMGPDYVAEVLQMAHAADPDAVLFINEQIEDYADARTDRFLKLLTDLVRRGVPVHGVGLQSHVISEPGDLAPLRQFLEKVNALGLKFELTEIDARLKAFGSDPHPLDAQARLLGGFVRVARSFANCTGVTFWGWSDKHTWFDSLPYFAVDRPNAPLLFDLLDQPKPVYWEVRAALAETAQAAPENR